MIEYLNAIASVLLLSITVVSLLRTECLDLEKIKNGIDSLKNISDFLSNLPRWIHFYNNLTANVQTLRNKKERLLERHTDLNTLVNDEEFQTGRRRKREVDNWLNCASTKCNEVEMLLRELQQGGVASNHFWKFVRGFWKFVYGAWLGNRVERKIQEVDDLYSSGFFEQVLSPVKERFHFVTTQLVGNAANENINRIVRWLGNGVTKIGVHGIKGIGKTAVMMHINNQLLRNDDVHVYMPELKDDNEYYLQGVIAKEVGIELQVEDEYKRAALLHRALKQRNFVLILDGVTKYVSEDKVGIPLDATKGKMIITSRSRDVCRKTGCHQSNMIAMDPLTDDEALSLFKQEAKVPLELESLMENVMGRIVEQCRGVPKKIVGMAREMRGVDDISVWEETLNTMSAAHA